MAEQKTPEQTPPNPRQWWAERRWQSRLGIAGLAGVGYAASAVELTGAQAEVLGYVALGCLMLIASYGGATLEDIVRAWRGGGS